MKKPTVTLTGDAKQVVGILAWAQEAGLSVATVTIGTCRVEMRGSAQPQGEERPAAESIYGRFGGPALASVVESGIPGNELQPAIGRGQ